MRRRPSVLLTGTAAVLIGVSVAASSAQVNTSSADASPRRVTLLSADPNAVPAAPVLTPVPETPPDAILGLDVRAQQAAADAANKGADIGFTLLDRKTGRTISGGDGGAFPIASVSKLFIADDLLLQVAKGQRQLTPQERQAFDVMLRSSDDDAAEVFWSESGGNDVISRVKARYGLSGTTSPYDGHWWNTMSTTADLVRYYSMLLDGTGGLPPEQAAIIMSDLSASTPTGLDGYPQRFGIPDGALRRTRCGQTRLDAGLERQRLDAHDDRGHRPRPAFRHRHGFASARRRRHRARHHHPGHQDDVPRRADLIPTSAQQIWAALPRALQRLFVTPRPDPGVITRQQHVGHFQSAPARRPSVARPLQQSRPCSGECESSWCDSGLPITLGSRRTTASIITSAAASPPANT